MATIMTKDSPTQMATVRPGVFKVPEADPTRTGEIVHVASGRRTALHKRGGIYVLRMWIPESPDVGFAGPGG